MLRVALEGMAVGLALAAPLGPINLEIVRRGLSGGFLHGWLVGLGAVSADTIYCVLVVGGLTPLGDSPALRAPLFLLGAAVLASLGVGALRSAVAGSAAPRPPSAQRSYATGFAMTAASPLGIVYWLSAGAALVASAVARSGDGAAPALVGGVTLGLVAWVSALSLLTRAGRRFVSERALRLMTGASGAALIAFGLYFGAQGIAALRGG